MPANPPVFDGHNDLLLKLQMGRSTPRRVRDGGGGTQVDLPKAMAGGFGGGMFALFAPDPAERMDVSRMAGESYDLPLPGIMDEGTALKTIVAQVALFRELAGMGVLLPCTSAAGIEAALPGPAMAAVLHLEGADCIDAEFRALHVLHALGLRSMGLVWSRKTRWAEGVPFRFPSTGDTGPGLTEEGRALVREAGRLRIALDLSHLNEAGCDDVAKITGAPLIASHSNAHALCPHARNLTDRQLDQIAETGGLVGLNFARAFLSEDGQMGADVALTTMIRHLDHLLERLGEGGVALGSDFDGAAVPREIGDVSGLPALVGAMRQAGYGEELIAKICHGNWVDVLRRTWGR
ncbi:dipeptidase [Pseudoroseicyclus tamaricis]|uniref:Membrane dipeptidase n=1 Tax=Pseudoroseicyclus tamaricis TaxID=2705421 RepID=A0A6B2JRZ8_9RHOB|nr:membrane dipeptidase [Pseudoroseicyclus tamaricis]NDV00978.1 membrane dipeptidase [Pseudoroseicyclus tamaricis]